jgi:hypothetical protein
MAPVTVEKAAFRDVMLRILIGIHDDSEAVTPSIAWVHTGQH